MRFRRRSFRRRSSPRRKLQWLNGASPDCSVTLATKRCNSEVPFEGNQVFVLVDNPTLPAPGDQVGSANEATVMRIVGEFNILTQFIAVSAAASSLLMVAFYMGIYVGDVDATGGVIIKDPSDLADANSKDWLWRGSYFTGECIDAGGTLFTCTENDPYTEGTAANGSHLDIRVKRKMRPEEQLVFSITGVFDQIIGSAISFSSFLYGNVRVLMKYT